MLQPRLVAGILVERTVVDNSYERRCPHIVAR